MLALRLNGKDRDPVPERIDPDPVPDGWVEVRLRAAALNHRDVWIRQGLYAGIRYPFTPGSDGAGYIGHDPVLINPGMDWGPNPAAQGAGFHILGMPSNGTFAQRVCVPASQVYPVPAHLSMEEAAAIPLAGVTAFRALFTRGRAQSGERMLITGIGGGVAQWVFRFGLAAGMEIWVTSGDEAKIREALRNGAAAGMNYKNEHWPEQARSAGGFDLVIDGAGGPFAAGILKYLNPGGRIVVYGGTAGAIEKLLPQPLFWKQIDILGSTMGTSQDFDAMMAFITRHRITPVLDQFFPLEKGAQAYHRMTQGAQTGKIILQIPDE